MDAKRELDGVTTSMSVLALNNLVVSLRPVVQQAKVHVVAKLSKQIKLWKKRHGSEEEKINFAKKAARMAEEIAALKKINNDKLGKFALGNTLRWDQAAKMNDARTKVMVRVAHHKSVIIKVKKWREEHEDWKALAAFALSKNTGRRIKTKKPAVASQIDQCKTYGDLMLLAAKPAPVDTPSNPQQKSASTKRDAVSEASEEEKESSHKEESEIEEEEDSEEVESEKEGVESEKEEEVESEKEGVESENEEVVESEIEEEAESEKEQEEESETEEEEETRNDQSQHRNERTNPQIKGQSGHSKVNKPGSHKKDSGKTSNNESVNKNTAPKETATPSEIAVRDGGQADTSETQQMVITQLDLNELEGELIPVTKPHPPSTKTPPQQETKTKRDTFFERGSDEETSDEEESEKEEEQETRHNQWQHKNERFNPHPKGLRGHSKFDKRNTGGRFEKGNKPNRFEKGNKPGRYEKGNQAFKFEKGKKVYKDSGKFQPSSRSHSKSAAPTEPAKPEHLHPSWEASRKRKQQQIIPAFMGKKIKFDD